MKKSVSGIGRGEVSQHPGHVFVKRGDVALTRALLKRGALRVVSKRGKRIEQIGVAALPEWIEAAQAEVDSTAGERAVARERGRLTRAAKEVDYREDFARAVRRLYPAIPDSDLAAVVDRALEVSSGRVGRSAAAKALADEPVRLAVLAHVRHVHTDYDARLRRAGFGQRFGRASREDRQKARKGVKSTIAAKAAEWAGGPRAPSAAGATARPADSPALAAPLLDSPGTTTPATVPPERSLATSEPAPAPGELFAAAAPPPPPPPAPAPMPARPSKRSTTPRFEQGSLWQRPLG